MTTTDTARILLVEDEQKLGNIIRKDLTEHGYDMEWAYDGRTAESLFRADKFDLVLLDINLPHTNGLELCHRFRNLDADVPIIMLTALGELDDKMEAFRSGADDYLVKPFHLTELQARVKVFLKRRQVDRHYDNRIAVGDLEIDFSHKSVTRAGLEVGLSAKEFALLGLLARSRGRVVSKQEIAEKVWDMDFGASTNTIEVYINFLRNKVDKPFEQKLIHTKPGFGYFLKAIG